MLEVHINGNSIRLTRGHGIKSCRLYKNNIFCESE